MKILVDKQKLIDALRKTGDTSFEKGLKDSSSIMEYGNIKTTKLDNSKLRIKVEYVMATEHDPTPEETAESLIVPDSTPAYDKLLELRRLVDETNNIKLHLHYCGVWDMSIGPNHYQIVKHDLIAAVNNTIDYIKTNRIITTPSDKKYYLR